MASAHADSPFGAIRACHIQIWLLRVFIHAKGGTFSTFERPLTFPGCYGGRGFWTFVMSFACHRYNFSFCEYIRAKAVYKYNYAGYNYVN